MRIRAREAALCLALLLAPGWLTAAAPPVMVLKIEGAIGPATADYVVRGLAHAATEQAQLAVLQMDTPGGLDTSIPRCGRSSRRSSPRRCRWLLMSRRAARAPSAVSTSRRCPKGVPG